jgi:hypothetical protein
LDLALNYQGSDDRVRELAWEALEFLQQEQI